MVKYFFKILCFILMLPINLIKYFCVGLYFVCSKMIEIVLYIVVFLSFLLYKTVKYFILFFTFPVLIFNLCKRTVKETRKNNIVDNSEKIIPTNLETLDDMVEPIVFIDEDVESIGSIIEEKNSAEPFLLDNIEMDKPPVEDNVWDIEQTPIIEENPIIENTLGEVTKSEAISEPMITEKIKKEKVSIKPSKILKALFLPFEIISYPVYKFFKYITLGIVFTATSMYKMFKYLLLGINYSLNLVIKAFIYLCFFVYKILKYMAFGLSYSAIFLGRGALYVCFFVYKIFKYLVYSLGFPVLVVNLIITKNKDKIANYKKAREIRRIQREEQKFKKQLEIQKKQEEKLRSEIKRKQDKEKEEYINKNVEIEKKTFKEKFDEFLNSIFNSPKVLADKIKSAVYNSVFMKNKRNKADINRQALLIDFEGEDAEKSDVKLVYEYTAKNREGKMVTDYFEAFSKVEVHSFLLSEGYEVYNIKTNKWIQLLHQKAADSKVKMKRKDLIFFLTQLSTYIKSGIPLVDSLKILQRQYSKNKRYERLFKTIIYDLSMGDNFSTALSKRGDAFPRILINMVKASEMTGELPEVLDDMAEYFTEMDKTRKQMITALMYPIIILVISIAVVVFILLFVIPKFVDIYKSMDASQIPGFTLAVLAVSDFLKAYSIHLLIGIVVITILLVYLYKNVKVFRTLCQWLFMHIPIVKNVIIYNEVTTFTKTFASLLGHNVYITDSMEILTRITNNEIYKMLILDTITNLAKGEKISASFKDHWAFPIPAYEMLVTGEQTGQLPEMMAKVSDYYQELHKNIVTRIKTFVEPILIIFLTLIVGIIVLSIIIPMFGMYQTVQGYS